MTKLYMWEHKEHTMLGLEGHLIIIAANSVDEARRIAAERYSDDVHEVTTANPTKVYNVDGFALVYSTIEEDY